MDPLAVAGILVFLFGLILSIALHELGHLIPAKLFGIKVTQYMIGFGKTVWSRRRGETEYGVKAIPVGGFVRMIGMFPPEPGEKPGQVRRSSTGFFQTMASDARRASREEIGPGEEERLFYRQAWWKKLIVMLGGPAMNVVLAVILAGAVLTMFGNPDKPVMSPVVSHVSECVIPASQANKADDCSGWPVAPAAQAGFRPGDKVVAVGGKPVKSWTALADAVADAGPGPVKIVVERNGERLTLVPNLIMAERPNPDGSPGEIQQTSFLGIAPTIDHFQTEGLAGALGWSGEFMTRTAEAMSKVPQRMVDVWHAAFGEQKRGLDTPMSIVGAGRIGGQIASEDGLSSGERIATFVMLLASFNMAIALFNLVPLLPLDGGHAAGAIWEAIKRAFAVMFRRPQPHPVDVAKALPLAYGVATVLVGMGVLLIYADIVNPISLYE
jgi:membrane-associated protease RseP (regulator of RpoE activity)